MGTTCSTPGAPSSPSRWTCSRSPIAPITVTSSPRDGWARAPTASMRSMTDSISASVAPAFITIIIRNSSGLRHWTLYGRLALGRPVGDRFVTTERLEKSPGGTARGAGVGIRGEEGGELSGAGEHGAEPRRLEQRAERVQEP